MNKPFDLDALLKDLAAPQRRKGVIALLVLAAAVAVFLFTALPLLGLLVLSPGKPVEAVAEEKMSRKAEEFGALLAKSTAAIEAREPFGLVRAGRRPAGPATASTPNKYSGPAIVGMVDDAVWFADGKKMKVGQAGEGASAVNVLSVDAPWNARIKWMGGEFTVSLFERDISKWSQPLSVWNGPPPVVAPLTAAATAAKPGALPGPGATAAAPPPPGGPPGAPGAPVVAPPSGVPVPASGQVIITTGGSGVIIEQRTLPPPPPPDEPEK